MCEKKGKVVVAMSGGVDSSVAAALLVQEGYEVIGVFMRLGSPEGVEALDESSGTPAADCEHSVARKTCCSVADAADARKVAGVLGIPLYILNFEGEFERVIEYFVAEYNRGRTPNPCVRCNEWLKFGKLAEYAEAAGAGYVATGHYARIERDAGTGSARLLRAAEHRKDQSYVLFGMSRELLGRTVFPVGGSEKQEVRAMALRLRLPVHDKPDSQEICFVPDGDYAGLIHRRSGERMRRGQIVDVGGRVLGAHGGHQHFTIGQRRGLGVSAGEALYVVAIDGERNRVTVGPKREVMRRSLMAREANWLSDRIEEGGGPMRCSAKIRYNHQPQAAVVKLNGRDEFTVTFDEAQAAITPGQAVVLYDGEVVLGGGWIEESFT